MSQGTSYDDRFFDLRTDGSLRSALAVVPVVCGMVRPRSVVDFGCGRAAWLRAFREEGVEEVRGLDGPYVNRSKLLIDEADFTTADLARPVVLGRRFDLAVCLEVGEHLPARASRTLVKSLTDAAPVVLFSAAVPGQGGTSHVNEQWPEYWETLFTGFGYHKLDAIRSRVLHDDRVEWWYRQNLYLYATGPGLASLGANGVSREAPFGPHLEIVGADVLGRHKTFRGLLGATVSAGARALRRALWRAVNPG